MTERPDSLIRARWLSWLPALVALVPFMPMLWRSQVPVLRDHADYFIPLRWFTARALRAGVLPHWNPLNGLGEPWLANPQTGILYPPNGLFMILPFETAYVLWLWFHLALLGVGLAVLCRRFAEPGAATFMGSVVIFTGPVLSMLDVSNNLASLAWLPWVAHAALENGRFRTGAAVSGGVLLAMAFLAGEPSVAAIAALIYVMLLGASRRFGDALVRSCIAAFTAIAVSAPQLFPFLHTLRGSDRSAGLETASAFANALAPADLAVMVTGGSSNQQFVFSLLLGPTLAVLVIAGVVLAVRERNRPLLVLNGTALVLCGLAFAGSFGPGMHLLDRLGLDAIRHPSRFIVPAIVLLAVSGSAALSERRRIRITIAGAGVAVILLAASAAGSRASDAWITLVLDVAVLVLLVWGRQSWRWLRPLGAAVIAVLLLVDGAVVFSSAPFETLVQDSPGPAPGTRVAVPMSVQENANLSRDVPLAGYSNLLTGVAKADSPAPVVPTRILSFFELGIERASVPVLSSSSVSRIHSRRPLPLTSLPDEEGWWTIDSLPLVSGWGGAVQVADENAALTSFLRGGADRIFATVALPSEKLDRSEVKAGVSPRPNGWQIRSESDRNVVLVIAERAAEGWTVSIDGRATEWFPVNGIFRGVVLPRGSHSVTWSYITPGWREGWWMMILSGLAIAAVWMRERGQSRRERIHDSIREAT